MLQHCCKAVVVQRHSTDLCVWVGAGFLLGCFFGVYMFISGFFGGLFDYEFFFYSGVGFVLFWFCVLKL